MREQKGLRTASEMERQPLRHEENQRHHVRHRQESCLPFRDRGQTCMQSNVEHAKEACLSKFIVQQTSAHDDPAAALKTASQRSPADARDVGASGKVLKT